MAVVGMMKDEAGRKIIEEFVRLRAKPYSYIFSILIFSLSNVRDKKKHISHNSSPSSKLTISTISIYLCYKDYSH